MCGARSDICNCGLRGDGKEGKERTFKTITREHSLASFRTPSCSHCPSPFVVTLYIYIYIQLNINN